MSKDKKTNKVHRDVAVAPQTMMGQKTNRPPMVKAGKIDALRRKARADSPAPRPTQDDLELHDEVDLPVTRATLETVPERTLAFLRAVGTNTAIRATLMSHGYTREDHEEGWRLLQAVSGFVPSAQAPSLDDVHVRKAIAELDAWDEDGFRLIGAALRRRHPEQAEFVLSGLGPSTGPAAVLGVLRLLERISALESSPERQASREGDLAALRTLASRGIDAAERARLARLVEQAQQVLPPAPFHVDAAEAAEQQYLRGLLELRAWYEEWSATARSLIKRRDHLVLLGLAQRRSAKRPTETPEPPTASVQ